MAYPTHISLTFKQKIFVKIKQLKTPSRMSRNLEVPDSSLTEAISL